MSMWSMASRNKIAGQVVKNKDDRAKHEKKVSLLLVGFLLFPGYLRFFCCSCCFCRTLTIGPQQKNSRLRPKHSTTKRKTSAFVVGSLQPDWQVQAAQNCIGYHYPHHAVAHPRNRYDTGTMLSPTQTIHINHGQITQSNLPMQKLALRISGS